jgi:outer membrane lipoprotein SlyB
MMRGEAVGALGGEAVGALGSIIGREEAIGSIIGSIAGGINVWLSEKKLV